MKRKILTVPLISVISILGFTSCGLESLDEIDDKIASIVSMANHETEYSNNGNEKYSDNTEYSDDAEYIGTDLYLREASDFSGGRAWVQFHESSGIMGIAQGGNRAALIDTTGQMLWKSEFTKNDHVLTLKGEFRDGVTYCIFNGDDKSEYIILDAEGNVTFTRDCDENYLILGHGNGLFLVAEHVQGFDADEWRVGAIDRNGNIVVPLKALPLNEYGKLLDFGGKYYTCTYYGDNIYRIEIDYEASILLNIESQSIISSSLDIVAGEPYCSHFITGFEDGYATVLSMNDGTRAIYLLQTDGTFTLVTTNEGLRYQLEPDMEFGDGVVFVSDVYVDYSYGAGYVPYSLTSSGAYYTYAGEKVIDFPEYDGQNEYRGGRFHNGYAMLLIEGADGQRYHTVINKNGEKMFEPRLGWGADMMSEDGKYFILKESGEAGHGDSVTVFDVNGNSVWSVHARDREGYSYNICDGMLRLHIKSPTDLYGYNIYVNLENGRVIGLAGD